MKVETFIYRGVKSDGTINGEEGAVHTAAGVSLSKPGGGCGADECNCSPGHWISVTFPREKNGTVRGFCMRFESRRELLGYLGLAGLR